MEKTKRKFGAHVPIYNFFPNDISFIRRNILKISQPLFAGLLGVSKQTINSWECGWRTPSPMATRLLHFVKSYPELVLKEIKRKEQ